MNFSHVDALLVFMILASMHIASLMSFCFILVYLHNYVFVIKLVKYYVYTSQLLFVVL